MKSSTIASAVIVLVSVAYLAWASAAPEQLWANADAFVSLAAGYGILLSTSGVVVRASLRYAGTESPEEDVDTGRAVGKVENVLVFTLAVLGAYTALGLVFTAKSIVRWQDMSSENTTYYLTGTITNFTYSLLFAILFDVLVGIPA